MADPLKKSRVALGDHLVPRHQAPVKGSIAPNSAPASSSTKATTSSAKYPTSNQPSQSNKPSSSTKAQAPRNPKGSSGAKRKMHSRRGPPGQSGLQIRAPLVLEPLEQDLIYRYLLARYHPEARLIAQGFTMLPGGPSQNPKKPAICTFQRTSPGFIVGKHRKAVVIDCEMVRVDTGRELAFLSAVDLLTGEVLIDNYVKPINKVTGWDSRYSGVTRQAMDQAVARGTAIFGWAAARSRLYEFVCAETVLIGHSLQNDLNVLGIIHDLIVDSSILTAEAVFPRLLPEESLIRIWGLKELTKLHLDYDIQVGRWGHRALEDAYATREMVIWCIRYPDKLRTWAEKARKDEERKAKERYEKREKEKAARKEEAKVLAELELSKAQGIYENSDGEKAKSTSDFPTDVACTEEARSFRSDILYPYH